MTNTVQNGFTLLELLVALAVFSVIAVAAYSGLSSVLTTQAIVEAEAERLKEVQMAFFILERDFEQAAGRGIRDEFGLAQPAMSSGGRGGGLITLTRAGWDNPIRDRRRATLQRLAYRLDPEQGLLRLYWDMLDRGGGEPRETVLLEDVESAEVRFLDAVDAWQSGWPPAAGDDPDLLPRAVELTLVLSDWGEIVRLFRLPDGPPPPEGP